MPQWKSEDFLKFYIENNSCHLPMILSGVGFNYFPLILFIVGLYSLQLTTNLLASLVISLTNQQ